MKSYWWKILTVILVIYSVSAGLLMDVPRLYILNESIRNLYFHVPMWFGMIFLFTASAYHSFRFLSKTDLRADIKAIEYANAGVVFGILGLLTGMVWAKFTWGEYWSNDPKQNASAIALLIYLAYFVLRSSFDDPVQKARVTSVYNIFAYAVMIPLIFVLPRLTDSLHPGNGGNPGFNAYDLDSRMRMVFYPSVLAFTLVGFWIADLRIRLGIILQKRGHLFDNEINN